MTQLGELNESLLPAHPRATQLWVQFCRHLENLSWGPRIHEEGAAVDITHLFLIALEAGRLVGVGHKAQFKLEQCIGAGLGTVYKVDQATLHEQLQQGSHAGPFCRLMMLEGVTHCGPDLHAASVPDNRKPTMLACS